MLFLDNLTRATSKHILLYTSEKKRSKFIKDDPQ